MVSAIKNARAVVASSDGRGHSDVPSQYSSFVLWPNGQLVFSLTA
jgi:hypothetical protein